MITLGLIVIAISVSFMVGGLYTFVSGLVVNEGCRRDWTTGAMFLLVMFAGALLAAAQGLKFIAMGAG